VNRNILRLRILSCHNWSYLQFACVNMSKICFQCLMLNHQHRRGGE